MFGRKKEKTPAPAPPKKKTTGAALMAQMGMGLDMDSIDSMVYGDLDNDEDLEAELRALQEEDELPRGRKDAVAGKITAKGGNAANLKSLVELDKMIAISLRDIPEGGDGDDDVSDTDDPELLAELEGLGGSDMDEHVSPQRTVGPGPGRSGVGGGGNVSSSSSSSSLGVNILATLQERSDNYQQALDSAKSVGGDAAKVRRLERGLQTLQGMLKQAKAGKPVSEADIPPTVVVPKSVSSGPLATQTAPTDPSINSWGPAPVTSSMQAASTVSPSLAPNRQAPVAPPRQVSGAPVSSQPSTTVGPSVAQAPMPKPRPGLPQPTPQNGPGQSPAGTMPSLSPVNVARAAVNAPSVPMQAGPAGTSTGMATDNAAAQREVLTSRRDQYKMAAIKAKQEGDSQTAINFMRIAKQFDGVIQAMDEGKPVDLTKMPPPPAAHRASVQIKATPPPMAGQVIRESKQGADSNGNDDPPLPELTPEDRQKLFKAPEKASSVMEALQQRMAKYKEAEEGAKNEGATSKMKRMGRIVKQYEDAIKQYKAGKPVDLEELPCPPGFPPFPVESSAVKAVAVVSPMNKPAAQVTSAQGQGQSPASLAPKDASATGTGPPKVSPKPGLQKQASVHSRAEQQTTFLTSRQAQFKQAAMAAKTSGDIELAKKYLRMAKGFDQMIEASKSGLPVDLAKIPPPPGAGCEDSFEFVTAADVDEKSSGDRDTEYKRLQDELVQQTKMCESNRDNFTKLGDISSAAKFDKMYQSTRKDLEALKNAFEHGDPVPRFHYENRQFSLVQSCADLGDNDLEITIVRGLNYNLPSGYSASDLVTFVRYEFPIPSENPQRGETDSVKGTNCPEYNKSFKLEVVRKSRSLLRLLKSSKCCKFEVWQKRGFLKGDKLLGTVNVKLQPLEDKCIYHDCYDLVEGRKSVGGRLEVKIRVRDPYVSKQVEEVKEKWLIIDQFDRKPPSPAVELKKAAGAVPAVARPSAEGSLPLPLASISVLRYEKQSLEQRMAQLKDRLNPTELKTLQSKGRALEKQAEELSEQLRKGGATANRAYVNNMTRLLASYVDESKVLAKQGNKDKLQTVLLKKKLVEKEIETIRSRYPVTS